MSRAVKANPRSDRSDLRGLRTADIEGRILDAASRLFAQRGYGATTLTAVAAEAGVADRTVYVRFGRKAALFRRVIDVAIVGDTASVDLRGRDWFNRATTAPTLEERIDAMVLGSEGLMRRFGPLAAASREAEAAEPELAAAAQAGREYTLGSVRTVWENAVADGLVSADLDVEWVISTTALLVGSDAFYPVLRMLRWSLDEYVTWLTRTLWQLATASGPMRPS